jgi:hypothetical protein
MAMTMVYADRKNTLTKKQIASFSKWANRPRTDQPNEITAQRRDLWTALNQYVIERGAAIVSVQYANPVRLEIPVDSPLADKLRELGYDLIFQSQESRIGAMPVEYDRRGRPRMTSGYGFSMRDVFLVRLPK